MDLEKYFPFEVDAEAKGLRLDVFLSKKFPDISRSRWLQLIEKGIFQSKGKTLKASHKFRSGEKIELKTPFSILKTTNIWETSSPLHFVGTPPEVIYEDEDVMVINKPVGLTVHPGAGVSVEETLVAWLLEEKKVSQNREDWISLDEDIVESCRPGIVHRLDRGTSGLMVVAKHKVAHEHLSKQFAIRQAGRLYWAVIEGSLKNLFARRPQVVDTLAIRVPQTFVLKLQNNLHGTILSQIDRHPSDRFKFNVCHQGGKQAITHMIEISSAARFSLVELKLETGRTHQIRVHLSFLGFPIVGDELYGGSKHSRLLLHAHSLHFKHPKTDQYLKFECPWPTSDKEWILSQGLTLLGAGEEAWTQLKSNSLKGGQRD